jgi:endonuclease G
MALIHRTLEENDQAVERAKGREREASESRDAARRGDLMHANSEGDFRKRLRRVSDSTEAIVSALATPAKAGASDAAAAIAQLAQERVMGQNDMVSVAYLELAMAAARSVCRVRLRTLNGRTVGYGTGFMVSPTLLLTNHHVLPDVETARLAQAEFDLQDDCEGLALEPRLFTLDPTRFFEADKSLDWALVALAPQSNDGVELTEFGWLPLIGATGKAANGEFLNIIQHPEGGPKQLALRENRLVDKLEKYLHYESDTARGSSGAPVFNDQWEVVALHHAAYPNIKDGKIMSVDGQPWTDAMGEDKVAWSGNEGVRASVLVSALGQVLKGLSGERRTLLQALLEGQRAPWPPFHRRGKPWPSPDRRLEFKEVQETVSSPGPVATGDGGVTWTIPLSLTIHVGALPAGQARQAEAPHPGRAPEGDKSKE